MQSSAIITVFGVLFIVLILVYRIQALHTKKIWNLSIQQIIFLILIPGIVFPMIFSYLQSTVRLPKSESSIISDGFLVNTILLSIMYSYGGIAIHAVTKMFSNYLKEKDSEIAQVNKFFHLTFSHNLVYSGMAISSLGITLLELNHIPNNQPASIGWGIFRGLVLGLSFAIFIYYYTRASSSNEYRGRWGDLKMLFGVIWISFSLLLYIVQKFDIGFSEYQLLLPMFLSFALLAGLSLILVIRRLKNGSFRIELTNKIKRIFSKKSSRTPHSYL
ncbi:MAG TPA: hypothetical protein VLH94_04820 [Spirochaetia bacterium]|nr:hypothetical protein [Spirochaetia bacterium]